MNSNKKGFSIIVGMGLVIFITLAAYLILAYILPFVKNVKGIENASNSYYLAYAGIEESLQFIKFRTSLTMETNQDMTPTTPTGISYSTNSKNSMIPANLQGNSEFDPNYNILSHSEPLQLEIGRASHGIDSLNWDDVKFIFKVPNLDKIENTSESLVGGDMPMINFLLSSPEDTLTATGESYILANQVNDSKSTNSIIFYGKKGTNLDDIDINFEDFYSSQCNGVNSGCTLKISLLNHLQEYAGQTIPYLEYKIIFPSGFQVPDRYTTIQATGKSYGFQKSLEVKVPQQTVNQALDFTVFQ